MLLFLSLHDYHVYEVPENLKCVVEHLDGHIYSWISYGLTCSLLGGMVHDRQVAIQIRWLLEDSQNLIVGRIFPQPWYFDLYSVDPMLETAEPCVLWNQKMIIFELRGRGVGRCLKAVMGIKTEPNGRYSSHTIEKAKSSTKINITKHINKNWPNGIQQSTVSPPQFLTCAFTQIIAEELLMLFTNITWAFSEHNVYFVINSRAFYLWSHAF